MDRIQSLISAGERPVVVLDLDATLFDVGPRMWHILREYADQHTDADLKEALKSYDKTNMPYLLKDILGEMNVASEDRLNNLAPHWFDRFFTDQYQHYDTPIAGAVNFAREIYTAGAFVVYLTGRDAPGMLVGCSESLRRHGFPVGVVRTSLIMKPDFDIPDPVFKEEACAFINGLGTIVASFDNEPGNCNIFQENWPDAINVFLDTQRASKEELPVEQVIHIKNFEFSDS
jgi:hypothetical protein